MVTCWSSIHLEERDGEEKSLPKSVYLAKKSEIERGREGWEVVAGMVSSMLWVK